MIERAKGAPRVQVTGLAKSTPPYNVSNIVLTRTASGRLVKSGCRSVARMGNIVAVHPCDDAPRVAYD